MDKPLEQIAAEALKLSSEDREALLEILLASLEPAPGYDAKWGEELDRRMQAVEEGTAELIPMEVVFSRLKSSIK